MRDFWVGWVCVALVIGVGCSVVNAPDDPVDGTATAVGGTTTTGTGVGGGGTAGTAGTAGTGGTGGAAPGPEINVLQGAQSIPRLGSYTITPAVDVGSSSGAVTFTIENLGTAALTVSSVSFTGGFAAHFSVDDAALQSPIAPNDSTTFDVEFAPLNGGLKTAELTIANDDSDESNYVISISGRTTANVWRNVAPANDPGPRFDHELVFIGNNRALTFGGRSGSTYLADTWVFNAEPGNWSELSPAHSPSARDAYAMVSVGNNKIILYGGKDDNGPLDETWEYDVLANDWTPLNPANPPTARYKHEMVYVGNDKVILYGGFDLPAFTFFPETWEYDVASNTWTLLSPTSQPANPFRWGHGMAYLGNDTVLMYGGWECNSCTEPITRNNTDSYSVTSNSWTPLSPSTTPPARSTMELAPTPAGFVVSFSGKDTWDGLPLQGTWLYDVAAADWGSVAPTGQPSPRFSYGMTAMAQDKVILYGGNTTHGSSDAVDDTWEYVTPPPP